MQCASAPEKAHRALPRLFRYPSGSAKIVVFILICIRKFIVQSTLLQHQTSARVGSSHFGKREEKGTRVVGTSSTLGTYYNTKV